MQRTEFLALEIATLAADAGEEELLLDALSVCGPALAVLGSALAPEALLSLGLLPEEVSLEPRALPYRFRLAIHLVSTPSILCVPTRSNYSHAFPISSLAERRFKPHLWLSIHMAEILSNNFLWLHTGQRCGGCYWCTPAGKPAGLDGSVSR
jgi:hypothetical protein